jgi:hypothetical protein
MKALLNAATNVLGTKTCLFPAESVLQEPPPAAPREGREVDCRIVRELGKLEEAYRRKGCQRKGG